MKRRRRSLRKSNKFSHFQLFTNKFTHQGLVSERTKKYLHRLVLDQRKDR
jgi:hypothetical protein